MYVGMKWGGRTELAGNSCLVQYRALLSYSDGNQGEVLSKPADKQSPASFMYCTES